MIFAAKYEFYEKPILVLTMAALTIMTSFECPAYIWLFCFLLWSHKWLSSKSVKSMDLKPLSRSFSTVLAVLILAIILFQYRTLFVQEAASSLLLALTAVKVSDYSNRRDHLSVILLGFLLLTLKPLYGLDVGWLPIQILSMLGLFWSLANDEKKLKKAQFAKLYLASIPLALALLVIFPRILLPWASMQGRSNSAKIGFSTDLKPGQFGDLADSTELVFRASFPDGMIIDKEELFWRGAILRTSHGIEWSRGKGDYQRNKNERPPDEIQSSFQYEIVIPNTRDQFLFTQDGTFQVSSPDTKYQEIQENIWQQSQVSSGSKRITATMSWGYRDHQKPNSEDLSHDLLPPKSREWVRKIVSENKELINRKLALKDLFLNSQLTYTRSPGIYSDNAIDEFLFDKKKGFCEHFAGTYATLARALGIPARVISGYQGGEYNKVGNFWRITQRFAHAWVEVWSGTEWTRVDPTTWPAHYESSRTTDKKWFDWVAEAVDTYDNINYRWTTFVLDFDQNRAMNNFKEMIPQLIMFILGALILMFILSAALKLTKLNRQSKKSIRKNELSELIEDVRKNLEILTEEELGNKTPLEVIKTAETKFSEASSYFKNLAHTYDQVFYQEYFDEENLKNELKQYKRRWLEVQILKK